MTRSWKVTASPRERFALSQLLLSPELKLRRRTMREVNNVRHALGLVGVSEVALEHKRVHAKYGTDNRTRFRFEITAEEADTILQTLEKVDVPPVTAMVLQPLVDQVEARGDAKDWEQALPFDEAAELPRWKPSRLPVVEDPEHLIEVLGELLKRADGDLRRLAVLYDEAMRAPPEEEEEQSPAAH
jgi:hypothetical protein